MGKRRQAYGIIYILNFGKTIKQKPLWVAKSKIGRTQTTIQTAKTAGTRYIGEKEISMRDAPGFGGKTVGSVNYGESVEYTGNKEKVDGLDWAEIKYGDKWISAVSFYFF